HGGPEIDVLGLEALGAHLHPPVEELRMPLFERALQPPVVGEAHVVRDALAVVDAGHHTLLRSNSLRRPVPYTSSAPLGPTALPRWKIQFCQAESRPKILLSSVSGPPKRIDASIPVSASGEKAARASIARRTSSSQSMSSGVNVTRPASAAAAASRSSPIRARSLSVRPGSARKRLASLVRPLTIGYAPKLISVSRIVAAGVVSPGRAPSSMYDRSAASTSSSKVPAKHEPGSTSAKTDRDETSIRLNVRLRYRRISRTSQSSRCAASRRSYASTSSARPDVLSTQSPISSSFVRRCRIRSSSSRASASGQKAPPASWTPAALVGGGALGPLTVISARPRARSISQTTWP